MAEPTCRYSGLYKEADKSFLVNFESKNLRPIRISLPSTPRLDKIDGWGLHPDHQKFTRIEIPHKLKSLEQNVKNKFKNKLSGVNGTNILNEFWSDLEIHKNKLKDEIEWMKKFIWHMWYGQWIFIDGKPTWLPPWYFSYLNIHRMTTDNGYSYPEYRDKGRLRFLFRHYILNTTETFADLDKEGIAYKIPDENGNMVYRMVDTGSRTFYGTIEPKDRRGGLTNEACHVITRIMTSNRGADALGTIVSMGGENAETHFRKKLIPAWNAWPLWLRPIWMGGFGKMKQLEFVSNGITEIETLDSSINFTDSADDLANDGKMLLAALYDEQGKGKRTGNVQNRWQVNKETMSLGGGSTIIGFCMHPSTVEKMEEGGRDYKDMCDLSHFYQRKKDGQTITGLALCYMPSSYCMEGYIDAWGQAVRDMPTMRQKRNGYKKRIGSKTFIDNKRKDLYDEDDPKKMDEYRSFVRKYPEDYDECWTGVAGQLGLDNEKIRKQKLVLVNHPHSVRGEFVWASRQQLVVKFVAKADGRWVVAVQLKHGEANQISTMLDYSAFEDDEIVVNRPANPTRFIMGVDPQQFSNKAESIFLEQKGRKQSDTSITVLQRRDKNIDISENQKDWKTRQVAAFFRSRLSSSKEATEEVMKAMIYYGALAHIETNRTEIWERLIEQRFGGYLNYSVEILAEGQIKRAAKPGTALGTQTKKKGFSLLADFITYHCQNIKILELLEELDAISTLEELTKFDGIASLIEALLGESSIYADLLYEQQLGEDQTEVLGADIYYY